MLLILEIAQNLTTPDNKKEIINRHQKKLCMMIKKIIISILTNIVKSLITQIIFYCVSNKESEASKFQIPLLSTNELKKKKKKDSH